MPSAFARGSIVYLVKPNLKLPFSLPLSLSRLAREVLKSNNNSNDNINNKGS